MAALCCLLCLCRHRQDSFKLWSHLRGHIECVVWTLLRQRIETAPVLFIDRRDQAIISTITKLTPFRLQRLHGQFCVWCGDERPQKQSSVSVSCRCGSRREIHPGRVDGPPAAHPRPVLQRYT